MYKNIDKLKYLLSNDFQWQDLKKGLDIIQKSSHSDRKLEIFEESTIVQEGKKKLIEQKVYERSNKLREVAIEHYTKNNDILCQACNFSFKKFYGEIGVGFIEIHHLNLNYS